MFRSLRHFLTTRKRSFKYAFEGLEYILKTQQNAWIHVVVAIFVVAMGLWLGLSRVEWALIVIVIGLVWTAEIANTSLEALVDLISPDFHHLAKAIKDTLAAYVLMTAIIAIIIGILILLPAFLEKLKLIF